MDHQRQQQYGQNYGGHRGYGQPRGQHQDNGWGNSPGRRGGHRGGQSYAHPQHQEQQPQNREENRIRHIRAQLFKLGEEKDFHPPSDLLKMARWVQERAKEGAEPIIAAFRVMVTEQPHKTSLIAALLGFLCLSPTSNRQSDEAVEATEEEDDSLGVVIVTDLVKAFRSYLDARLWRSIRLSLHLFAALVPLRIISTSSLRNLLTSFAAVLDEPGVTAARGDRASLCIIETLCHAGQDLLIDGDHAQSELDSLVQRVVTYDAARKVDLELTTPVHNSDTIALEGFQHAVSALEALRVNNYQRPAFLPSPTDLLPAAISASTSTVPEHKRVVALPDVLVPPDEDEEQDGEAIDVAYAQLGEHSRLKKRKVQTGKGDMEERKGAVGPERVGLQPRWFPSTSVPATGTPSSVIMRAIIGDMVDLYEVNRKDAARLVLQLPTWFRRGTFAGAISPELGLFGDETGDRWWVAQDGTTEGGWSLDDLIVETLISTALVMPTAPRNPLYYTALLREIVCLTPGTIAPSLGRTIRSFYNAMPNLDVEAVQRFADWFAIHLSNFNFGWAWREWVPDADLVYNHPKKAFMRRTVELEVRLAYFDRIKQTLPVELQQVASIVPPNEPLPVFTYSVETHPYHTQATRLISSIKAKAAAEVIMADFESFKTSIFDPTGSTLPSADDAGGVNNAHEADLVVRDLTIQCVLEVGSRSFSHFLNIVERYHTLLRQLSRTPRMRIAILAGSARFWRQSAQWIQIVTDKLLQYRIVEPADVVDFLFHPLTDEPSSILAKDEASLRDWSTFSAWNLLNLTLDKVNGRVDLLQRRLVDIQRSEADEAERREAMLSAGFESETPQESVVEQPKQPLFPTSATLPTEPEPTTAGIPAKLSSAEALTSLDAVKSEQRKVLINTISGFATLLGKPSAADEEAQRWAQWWVKGWYTQFCRAYNRQLREIRQLATLNCFTEATPAYMLDTFTRAIDLINE